MFSGRRRPIAALKDKCSGLCAGLVAAVVICPAAGAESLRAPEQLEAAAMQRAVDELNRDRERAGATPFALPNKSLRSMRANQKIANGIGSLEYPSSGALLLGQDRRSARVQCSGTLIGCNTFLTAAHCFMPDSFDKPDHFRAYLQHAGFFEVDKVSWIGVGQYVHPTAEGGSRADVALVKLKTSVSGITPAPLNRGARPAQGTPGFIVGFGRTGGLNYNYGIKRVGQVSLSECAQTYGANLVCWNYEGLSNTPGQDSNTCNADSGGGLHVGADEAVAGITS